MFSRPLLSWLRAAIERRELDVPPTLDEIIRRLNAREYPDMRTAALARKVIESARQRKTAIAYGYRMEILNDPSLWSFYDKYLEGWDRP
jgi:hypothetical protein